MSKLDNVQLQRTLAEPPFEAADRILVRYLASELHESNPWIRLSGALANLAVRQGHAFLDLDDPKDFQHALLRFDHPWPTINQWTHWSQTSPTIGGPAARTALVLDGTALYLRKYYHHERRLAELIGNKSLDTAPPATSDDPTVRAALRHRFFVVTGGPGTGKTTLALRFLNAFLDAWDAPHPARFAAIAPTGKAAARLEQSIRDGIQRMNASSERMDQLSATPTLTIHRLLGALPNQVSFRHGANRPVDYDVLVIDECSMIDLPLMRRLFEAIPQNCSTLLLGDRDQLSSVEVGSVFNDLLVAAAQQNSPLQNKTLRLAKTYRFKESSSIFQACRAAREGDVEVFDGLIDSQPEDFAFHALGPSARKLPQSLLKQALDRHRHLERCQTPAVALEALEESIILSATRVGPFGSRAINREVEQRLRASQNAAESDPIHACPIIVLENNYELELFNGDLGIFWQDENGRVNAWFASSSDSPKRVSLSSLPKYDIAFALTIHKSQGSEFDETVAIVPPQDSELVTRELLYTALSRARSRLVLYGNRQALSDAIQRRVTRATGLAKMLGTSH